MITHFWRSISFLGIFLFSGFSVSWADEGKISGYFFGDYYRVLKSHDAALEDRNGFQFRRVYFTYDRTLSDQFATRFRLEMNSPSFPDSDSNRRLEPFVKHGYLAWKQPDWGTTTYFGLSGTPTWGLIEKVWGYRAVAKTLLDLQRVGNSSDLGVALKGKVNAANVSYHVMFGNGSSTSGEINQEKKAYLSLAVQPIDGLVAEGYVDYEAREENKDRYTLQAFLGYQVDRFRVGAQVANQTRQQGKDREDLNLTGVSVFGATRWVENSMWVYARFDRMFDPNPDGEKIAYTPYASTAKSNAIIVGLDWTPLKEVHIMPHLFVVFYDEPEVGDKPDTDIMPRLTLFYNF